MQNEDFLTKKNKALLELMGPQSNNEDRAKLAMFKYYDSNIFNFSFLDDEKINNNIEKKIFKEEPKIPTLKNGKTSKPAKKKGTFFQNSKQTKKLNKKIPQEEKKTEINILNNNHTNLPQRKTKTSLYLSTEAPAPEPKKTKKVSTGVPIKLRRSPTEKENILVPEEKENYLDILITAAENLISKGLITLDYLNGKPNFLHRKQKRQNKCKNPICMNSLPSSSSSYCEQCTQQLQKGNYCHYCKIIYNDNYIASNKKNMIQCNYCNKFQHIHCEETKGHYHITKLIMNENFKYMCPLCRFKLHNDRGSINDIYDYKNALYDNTKNKIETRDLYYDMKKLIELEEDNNGNHHHGHKKK